MSYNGWKNYETWAVNLWLENDEDTYNYVRDRAGEVISDHSEDGDEGLSAKADLSDWLKEFVEGLKPDLDASMFSDLLDAALSEVDWFEIAEAWLENARDETQDS